MVSFFLYMILAFLKISHICSKEGKCKHNRKKGKYMDHFVEKLLKTNKEYEDAIQAVRKYQCDIRKQVKSLTIEQVKKLSQKEKEIILNEFRVYIDDENVIQTLKIELRKDKIKNHMSSLHYPFLLSLNFLSKEQICELDQMVYQMEDQHYLYKGVFLRKMEQITEQFAEYENNSITDKQWKDVIDVFVKHHIGRCRVYVYVNFCNHGCAVYEESYKKIRSGKCTEEEKEEFFDEVYGKTCGCCELNGCCPDEPTMDNFMDLLVAYNYDFQKIEEERS